jgi:superfamily II DNA helicase RecQ
VENPTTVLDKRGRAKNVLTTMEIDPAVDHTTISQSLGMIAIQAMKHVFGKEPREWQPGAILKLIQVNCNHKDSPTPFLLCQNTGGGKSLARDTAAVILQGLTLVVTPLLALGADQCTKLSSMIPPGMKHNEQLRTYHLDDIVPDSNEFKGLVCALKQFKSDDEKTIILFTSPQTLQSETWLPLIKALIKPKILRMVCIDEVHLFVSHGLFFRQEFFELKRNFFDHLAVMNIPVLFMTATATKTMLEHLKHLTGFEISESNLIWPGTLGMARRNIHVTILLREQSIGVFKSLAIDILKNKSEKKLIVYTNTVKKSDQMADSIRDWMDESGEIPGDVVHVKGDLFKEQKFYYINLFLSPSGPIQSSNDTGESFDPRVLVATAGSANAGIDSDSVCLVLRDGFPASISDLLQEIGRAGRHDQASPMTDGCRICISLKHYVLLLMRIGKKEEAKKGAYFTPAAYMEYQLGQLKQVSQLLVLKPDDCVQVDLESEACNPYARGESLSPCVNACSACTYRQEQNVPSCHPRGSDASLEKNLSDRI